MIKLSIHNLDNNDLVVVEMNKYSELLTLKNIIATKTGIPQNNQILTLNNETTLLEDNNKNIFNYKITEDDLIYLKSKQVVQTNNTNPIVNFEKQRFLIEAQNIKSMIINDQNKLNNVLNQDPELGEAILNDDTQILVNLLYNRNEKEKNKLNELYQNYMDPKNQAEIEKIIKRKRLDDTLNMAQDYMPELFVQTQMLFVKGKVNGVPVQIFLDTGAQICVMPLKIAEKCNLIKDIDDRYKGLIKGVGTQNSLGKIHVAQLEIKEKFFNFSITVLENMSYDLILGLDFFKRHRCCLDLNSNSFKFPEVNIEIPFLNDNDITLETETDELDLIKKESMVEQLMKHGLNKDKATEILKNNNWDLDKAYNNYLDSL